MVKGNRKDRRSKREDKMETEKEDRRDRSGREDKREIEKDKTEEWR